MSFSLIESITIFGAIQGVFLSFILPHISKSNKKANRVLSYILFLSTFMLVGRLIYFRFPHGWPLQITLIPDVVIYIFGPLLWLYVYKLVISLERLPKNFILHFIPATLHLLGAFYCMQFSNETYINLFNKGQLTLYFKGSELAAIFSNSIYLYISFKIVFSNSFENAKQEKFRKYLIGFLSILAVIVGVWTISFLFGTYFNIYISYDHIWILIPTTSLFIGYNAISRPELFKLFYKPSKILGDQEIQHLTHELDSLINHKKIYRQPKLTLQDTAIKLGTTPNKLSWLLNKSYGLGFYGFINKYRVEEIVTKINKGEHHTRTLLGLAFDSGFNSKTTFNKFFKHHIGETPSAYLKKIEQKSM